MEIKAQDDKLTVANYDRMKIRMKKGDAMKNNH